MQTQDPTPAAEQRRCYRVPPGYFTRRELEHETGWSRSHIYRLMHAGKLPRPVRFGPNRVGWKAEEVREYVAACERQSRVAA